MGAEEEEEEEEEGDGQESALECGVPPGEREDEAAPNSERDFPGCSEALALALAVAPAGAAEVAAATPTPM